MINNFENLSNVLSNLESQICRNPNLPAVYSDNLKRGFSSVRDLDELFKTLKCPWRISGKTEDDRMYKLSNSEGFVVVHVYTKETADLLVELTRFFST